MVFIFHHLGLGDHIICNGLVRRLQKNYDSAVTVLCAESNLQNVLRMYRDNDQINVLQIKTPENGFDGFDYEGHVRSLFSSGSNSCVILGLSDIARYPNLNFDEVFYMGANLPFSCRWTDFYIERDLDSEAKVIEKLNPNGEKFIFVHDDPSRGYTLNVENPEGLKVIKNDLGVGLFDMAGILERAEEIHCMESSIKCLIESLNSIKAKLYLHTRIRGYGAISKHIKEWIVK